MKCIQDGHILVAVANLEPPEKVEELDSFMYQSVGHQAIPYIAQALSVPLVRDRIVGKPINQEINYVTADPEDEVEDLYRLLARVQQEFPEVEAVSAGAIFSTYQKLRVEQVAKRLRLSVLAPLWHRDQLSLVKEMISSGVFAVVIKVATLGLNAKHIGMTLNQFLPCLEDLSQKWQFQNYAGEGGEYETLVLDAPIFFSRLEITEKEVVEYRSDPDAPVYFLVPRSINFIPKYATICEI